MFNKITTLIKTKITDNKTVKIAEQDDSIKSITLLSERLIEDESTNLIVLIKYTDKHSDDAIIFLEAFTGYYKFRHSSWEEKIGVDEDGKDIIEIHVDKYLLISGWVNDYVSLFDKIDNLDNTFIQAITKDIYQHFHGEYFKTHIKNNILSPSGFKDEHSNGTPNNIYDISYTDYKALLSKLPAEFTLIDILEMCDFRYQSHKFNFHTLLEAKDDKDILHLIGNNYYTFCKIVFPNIDLDEVRQAIKQPRYLLSDDLIQGTMEEYELSEIFKAEYDRYTMPIIDENDEDIKFEDLVNDSDDESIEILEDLGETEE